MLLPSTEKTRYLRTLMDLLAGSRRNPAAVDGDPGSDEVLFYPGNPLDPVPKSLLLDPLLGAVDIVTWQAIRLHAGERSRTRFPSQGELMRVVRVSRPTLGRAIMALRLLRWLTTSVVTGRDEHGQAFRRRIYILHDGQIPVADATCLDPDYPQLVARCCNHRHPPLANVARAIQEQMSVPGSQDADGALTVPSEKGERNGPCSTSPEEKILVGDEKHFFRRSGGKNIYPVDYQAVNESAGRTTTTSTTTTTETDIPGNGFHASEVHEKGIGPATGLAGRAEWPEPLMALLEYDYGLIDSLTDRLGAFRVDEAQAVLDEAAGALVAKIRRREPVDNPPGYILALIRRAEKRQFQPTLYRQAGRAMRYERRHISHEQLFDGESAVALVYAQTGELISPEERLPVPTLSRESLWRDR